MGRILTLHDNEPMLCQVEELLNSHGHTVRRLNLASAAQAAMGQIGTDLVIIHDASPNNEGLEALRCIRRSYAMLPVIVVANRGTLETAVEAMKLGAFEYYGAPYEIEEILRTIERALKSRSVLQHMAGPLDPSNSDGDFVGRGPAMQEVYKAVARVAHTDAPVLIIGDRGSGKELVARCIHRHSPRATQAFLSVDCRMASGDTLESEIFGHEVVGGANPVRIGKLERVPEGTVLLRRVGTLNNSAQSRLLHALDYRCFERVGGSNSVRMQARVLATDRRELETAVAQGRFHEHLYQRLGVVTIHLPSLRERPGDIPDLALCFLHRFARDLQVAAPPLTRDAVEAMCAHTWPGNVRELELCIQRALIMSQGYPVQKEDIARCLRPQVQNGTPGGSVHHDEQLLEILREHLRQSSQPNEHREFLQKVDRMMVLEALRLEHGNQTRAARLLGLPRPTLHSRMEKYGINAERHGDAA